MIPYGPAAAAAAAADDDDDDTERQRRALARPLILGAVCCEKKTASPPAGLHGRSHHPPSCRRHASPVERMIRRRPGQQQQRPRRQLLRPERARASLGCAITLGRQRAWAPRPPKPSCSTLPPVARDIPPAGSQIHGARGWHHVHRPTCSACRCLTSFCPAWMVGISSVDFRHAAEQLLKNSPRHVLGPDREEDGGRLGAHGHAQRRIRQLSTKQQQLALVDCHRHTVKCKLREDDAPIGALGLPREQLRARCQTPQGCGVAPRRGRRAENSHCPRCRSRGNTCCA